MKTHKFYILIKVVQLLNSKWSKLNASLILAQAIHETGNFSSPIFLENKNLFGMKKPAKRTTTVTGENRGHATYKSYWDSIKDYFLRQEEFNLLNPKDDTDYMLTTQRSGYATDVSYVTKWKQIYEQFKGQLSKANYLWIVLIIVLPLGSLFGLYWAYKKFIKKGVQ